LKIPCLLVLARNVRDKQKEKTISEAGRSGEPTPSFSQAPGLLDAIFGSAQLQALLDGAQVAARPSARVLRQPARVTSAVRWRVEHLSACGALSTASFATCFALGRFG